MKEQTERIKVGYVALYPEDFFCDIGVMAPEVAGAYCRLIMKLYIEGGQCSNSVQTLSEICGYSEGDFPRVWDRIKHKFQGENGILTHKRVTEEIQKARKRLQDKRRAGLRSGEIRRQEAEQRLNTVGTALEQCSVGAVGTALRNENETRTRRDSNINPNPNTNTSKGGVGENQNTSASDSIENPLPASDSSRIRVEAQKQSDMLFLIEALRGFFRINSNGDRTCLENIARWATTEIAVGHRDRDFLKRVIDLAEETRKEARRNRWGYFLDVLRRDLGYIPPTKRK